MPIGASPTSCTRWGDDPLRPAPGNIPTLGVPSLEGVRAVHLIGVGGAGMRNLARLFLADGLQVTGSDMKDSKGLRELRSLGADVWVGHDPARLSSPDVVIVSSAIGPGNAELVAARARGIEVWARQQALAALASSRRAIAIAGTHGKTTTTSMVAVVLERAGLDPELSRGRRPQRERQRRAVGRWQPVRVRSRRERRVVPVGESLDRRHHQRRRRPRGLHPGGRDEIEHAFAAFAARCGHVVACGDDAGVRRALELAGADATTYGLGPDNDLILVVDQLGPSGSRGTVRERTSGRTTSVSLQVDGEHNLLDATAALIVGELVGVDPEAGAGSLATLPGSTAASSIVARRVARSSSTTTGTRPRRWR